MSRITEENDDNHVEGIVLVSTNAERSLDHC